MPTLAEIARSQQDYVVDVRRELHRYPELRWEEERTIASIRAHINAILRNAHPSFAARFVEGKGGIWVDIDVNPRAQRILLRTDIDALPISEETGLSYASRNEGVMHACGHDAHAAMLLGFLRAIASGAVAPRYNLRLVFQRAEENPITTSGGDYLVNKEGVCGKIARAYGLHLLSFETAGAFFSRPGILLGNSGRIGITIKTQGGHAGRPNRGTNAIEVAEAIIANVKTVPAQALKPGEAHSLQPVTMHSGTASNVLPAQAEIWYAARTVRPRDEHMAFMQAVVQRVKQTARMFSGARVSCKAIGGHPPTVNTQNEVRRIIHLLRNNEEAFQEIAPVLGGEDFGHYLLNRPGAFVFLGADGEGAADHHSPHFNPDESILTSQSCGRESSSGSSLPRTDLSNTLTRLAAPSPEASLFIIKLKQDGIQVLLHGQAELVARV